MALQRSENLIGATQARLSSGKKVASVIDNANAFFLAQGFLSRASDLSNLKDSMLTALQVIKTASDGILGISAILTQAAGVLSSALETTDAIARTALADQYNALLNQIDNVASDSIFNGTNLLTSNENSLVVYFNATGTSSLNISGVNVNALGLGISRAQNAFLDIINIQQSKTQLTEALDSLRSTETALGNNTALILVRSSFTDNMINNLQTSSDTLVAADLTQEGANLQSLQARYQLGIVAIGITKNQRSLFDF